MILEIYSYKEGAWDLTPNATLDSPQTLVLLFGSRRLEEVEAGIEQIGMLFPQAIKIGCSTAGEIYGSELYENSLSVAVIRFAKTQLKAMYVDIDSMDDSEEAGMKIGSSLQRDDLKGIFLLSDGLRVNGSKLTQGIAAAVKEKVAVTGGLAGDDSRYERTWVLYADEIREGRIVAVGFYGTHLHMHYASKGGWNTFGIDRTVTRSEANVLYELDGKPALDLYKTYLGSYAQELPFSGLLFPLMVKEGGEEKVRTISAVDEEAQSITFAGDIPMGAQVSLMRANIDNLIEGAENAAERVAGSLPENRQILAVAISCVGRKLVLGQRTEDELEAVLEALPQGVRQVGFYSYGEISPLRSGKCDLHNQTMTLTLWWES